MLRLFGWLIKTSAFALVVLIAANYFKIGKHTVSDQIRLQLSHAENAADVSSIPQKAHAIKKNVASWARHVTSDENEGTLRKFRRRHAIKIVSEEIPSSERQKLRELMRELNSSRASN